MCFADWSYSISSKPRIAVLSGHIGDAPYLEYVQNNHRGFADRHGYAYEFYSPKWDGFETDNPLVDFGWIKVSAAARFIEEYDAIFWIDSDSVFQSIGKSLGDLLEFPHEMVVSGDVWDVFNTGHFLLKSGTFSASWLRAWSAQRGVPFPTLETTHQDSEGRLNEQPVANALLSVGISKSLQEITAAIPEGFRRINGFIGNESRLHTDFHRKYAPNKARNLSRTSELLHPSLRDQVKVVSQRRLNGYVARQRGEIVPTGAFSPIIHFAGSKAKLIRMANK